MPFVQVLLGSCPSLSRTVEVKTQIGCAHKVPHKNRGPIIFGEGLPLKAYLLSASAELTVNPSSSGTVVLIFTQMLNRWCDKLELPLPTQSHGTPNYVQSSYFPHRIKTNQRAVNIQQIKNVAPVRRQDLLLRCHNRGMKMWTPPTAHFTVCCCDSSCSRSCDTSEMAQATGTLQLADSETGAAES